METVMAVLTGVLVAIGLYLIMQKTLLRIIIGASLLGYASLVSIFTVGGLNQGMPPILSETTTAYADPIPQALMLTAIVIGFGGTALQLILAYRTYQEMQTDDLDKLRNREEGDINDE